MSHSSTVRAVIAGLCLGAVTALSGCGQDPAPIYAQAFGYKCDQHHSADANRWCRKTLAPGAAEVSRYCYKSLADANCFDRPDPDGKNQVLGSSGY